MARMLFVCLLLLLTSFTVQAAEPAFDKAALAQDFAAVEFKISNKAVSETAGTQRLVISLSVPLDPALRYSSYITVVARNLGKANANSQRVDGDWVLSDDGRRLSFNHVLPNHEYKIDVSPNLKAINGKAVLQPTSFHLRTPDMPANVAFMMNGSVLPVTLAKGLAIRAVNVNQIDIDFHRVDKTQMLAFLQKARIAGQQGSWQLQDIVKNTALVYSARYKIKNTANKRADWVLPVEHLTSLKSPGIYFAVMKPAGTYPYEFPVTYFMRSDLGLSATHLSDQLEVHVNSLSSGLPLMNAKLVLLDKDGRELHSAHSDAKGAAVLPRRSGEAVLLTAEAGDYFSLLELTTPTLDLSAYPVGGRSHQAREMFLYGPRDLYRPGETAKFSGLLRDHDGRRVKTTALSARIKRPDGQVVKEWSWQGDAQGYYVQDFALPRDAATGTWTLETGLGSNFDSVLKFRVEEFLPERMELELNGPDYKPLLLAPADTLNIPVLGRYLYGAPAAGNKFSARIKVEPLRELPGFKGYFFGDVRERSLAQEYEMDAVKLDAEGKTTLEILSRWGQTHSPLAVKITGELFESGGRPVVRRQVNQVWPQPSVFGIRPLWTQDTVDAYSSARFELIKATREGTLSAHKNVDVELVRYNRSWYWYSDDGQWNDSNADDESPVWSQRVNLTARGASTINVPLEWGWYRLDVRDSKTGLMSSYKFFAGWRWYGDNDAERSKGPRPDQVQLMLDKSAYKPGDMAKLRVQAPDAGVALVAVHAERTLWEKQVTVGKGAAEIQIPIPNSIDGAWDRHDLYVSVTVIRPGNNKASIAPKRALGIIPLPLAREDRRLQIQIDAPAKTQPNRKLNVKLKVANAQAPNAHATTHITLAAVDIGVLQMTRFQSPDPHTGFFGQRRYGGQIHDLYAKVMDMPRGDLATQAFGGDADLVKGGELPQSEVQIVSLFSGPVQVDAQGMATVALDLPEFNGRLRLMALAYNDDAYGHAEQEIEVAAPVVTEIAMPRFLAPGDKSWLTLDLHNRSGTAQALSLSLTENDLLQLGDYPKQIELKKEEKRSLRIALHAKENLGQAAIKLQLKNASAGTEKIEPIDLQREWKLGLRATAPATRFVRRGLVAAGSAMSFDAAYIKDYLPGTVHTQLALSAQPPFNLEQYLEQLIQYPYGCLEQTSSRLWPLLMMGSPEAKKLNLTTPAKFERSAAIQEGLSRVLGMQKRNGGFGFWDSHAPETPYMTVYVSDMLLDAREQGFSVPDEAINNAMTRLNDYLNGSLEQRYRDYSDHYSHGEFALRAYAGYVLARVQRAPLSQLRLLAEKKADARSLLPLVHLSAALQRMGDATRAQEMLTIGAGISRNDREWLGDYGSTVRDLALSYRVGVRNKLDPAMTTKWLTDLDDNMGKRYYWSTQDLNAVFFAGLEVAAQNTKAWSGELRFQDKREAVQNTQPQYRRFSVEELSNGLVIQAAKESPVYARLSSVGVPRVAPPALDNGINIKREYLRPNGSSHNLQGVKAGDLVVVKLTVQSEQRIPDALVVDLLPAGFELENQNLEGSVDLADLRAKEQSAQTDQPTYYYEGEDETNEAEQAEENAQAKKDNADTKARASVAGKYTKLAHVEFRDDRFVAALNVDHYYGVETLYYLMRAVTPGDYVVPAPLVESMYKPEIRSIGKTPARVLIGE